MGMDPKQMRVLENGQASEEDLPRDTSREAVRDQAQTGRMKARREHSKGDGNFPSPEPSGDVDEERPEDSTATDDAKTRDRAESGMSRARRSATPKPPAKRARPTARRSSAAKRDAVKRVVKPSAPKKAKTRGGAVARAKTRGGARSRGSRSRR